MKKTLKKVVATALAFSMVFGVLPTAYAANNEVSQVKIGGVTFDFSVPVKPTNSEDTPNGTYEQLKARTVTLHMTEEATKDADLKKVDPTVVGTTAAKWFIVDSAEFSTYDDKGGDINSAAVSYLTALTEYKPSAANAGAGLELKEDDIIILQNNIATGTEPGPGFYAFKVSFGNSGAIEGENDVKNAALNVVLPTNLDFSLDPLELTAAQVKTENSEASGRIEGSQIKSADYAIINKTGAPVKVAFDLEVVGLDGDGTKEAVENDNDEQAYEDKDGNVVYDNTGDNGPYTALYSYPDAVEFVNSPEDIDGKDDDSITTKKIYMAAVGAADSSDIGAALTFAAPTTFSDTAFLYDYMVKDDENNDVLAEAAAGFVVNDKLPTNQAHKGGASIAFALGAATDATGNDGVLDALADANGGVTSFSLYGELNTYAKWEGGDINLSGAYTLTALRGSSYDLMTTEEIDDPENTGTDIPNPDYKIAAGSLNVMKVASAAPAGPTEPAHDVKAVKGSTVTYTADTKTTGFKIYFPEKPANITVARTAPSDATYTAGTHYTYDADTGILTNVSLFSGSSSSATIKVTAGSDVYTLTLTATAN